MADHNNAHAAVPDGSCGAADLEVEYLGLDNLRLEAIKQSASDLVAVMFGNFSSAANCDCVWPLIDAVWPARSTNAYRDHPKNQITLTLVPLSRIGQMEGKSGSLVLIGCFRDSRNSEMPPSHPVVVKTAPISTGKLKQEYGNALTIRPFAYQHKDVFSIPFRKDERGGFDVLWSLFSASDTLWNEDLPALVDPSRWKVRDLRDLLDDNKLRGTNVSPDDSYDVVSQVLKTTYGIMRNLHVPFGKRQKRRKPVLDEYEWYLRSYPRVWGEEWESVFGSKASANTQFAGQKWANPLWVVDQLKDVSVDFTMGAVHGDLHPGNIVITSGNQPRIIDFGWARDDANVAKDFVLMECNLRFLFLRPQLTSEAVERLASWIKWDAELPVGLDPYCEHRCNLICTLRTLAREAMGEQVDWNQEYLLPLFLVAFGLLRFAPQLGNQHAAILTVLALATQIRDCGVINGVPTASTT